MKKFFSLFVIAGLAVVGLVVFYLNHHSEMKAKEFKEKLASTRQKYAEKSAGLRSSGTPNEYVRDQNELLKAYKADLEKLAKLDESVLDVDHEKKKFAEADEKKPPSAEQKKLRDEYFTLAKTAYENLLSGAYRPVLTAFNNGARLDITSLKRVTKAFAGRSATSCPVFLFRYTVATEDSSAGSSERLSFPTLAPVAADAPSAMQVN